MKRILLLLSLLLAPSALADDAVTSFGWNSVTGTFQAMTRALGWKSIPDYETMLFNTTFTPNGAASTGASQALALVRSGKMVTIYLGTMSGITCAGTSTAITNSPAIPVQFRPNGATIIPIGGYVNGGSNTNGGNVQVVTGGTITINRDIAGTAFSAGQCNPLQAVISYVTP